MLSQYRLAAYCSCQHGGGHLSQRVVENARVQQPPTCYNKYRGGYVFLLFQVF